jgi:hypothetical protein
MAIMPGLLRNPLIPLTVETVDLAETADMTEMKIQTRAGQIPVN